MNQRRSNKKKNETDGFWIEGVEREGGRGGEGDKLQRALTNGTTKVSRFKIKQRDLKEKKWAGGCKT